MKQIFAALLTLSLLSPIAWASVECPKGEKETELTLQRVMRNLGRFIRHAESVTLQGIQWPLTVTDQDLVKAYEDLDIVLACTEAAINDPSGNLLPAKVKRMTSEEQFGYTSEYLSRMNVFRDDVLEFKAMFKMLLETETSKRDFSVIHQKSVRMNQHIDNSHRELSCWELLPAKPQPLTE